LLEKKLKFRILKNKVEMHRMIIKSL
jgi:hypothetical protein